MAKEVKREIKFRAWDKKRKVMTTDFGLKNFDGDYFIPEAVMIYDEDMDVMQFTGLLDKNGKEIYEGDIMKVLDRDWSDAEKDTKLYIVYWHMGGFQLVNKVGIEEKGKDNPNIYNKDWLETVIYKEYGRDRFEIIGNIYENPDLLTNN